MATLICKRCNDPGCDTDCGERDSIYREHRRAQLAEIADELSDDSFYDEEFEDFFKGED